MVQGTSDLFWTTQIVMQNIQLQDADRTQWLAIATNRNAKAEYFGHQLRVSE